MYLLELTQATGPLTYLCSVLDQSSNMSMSALQLLDQSSDMSMSALQLLDQSSDMSMFEL